MKCILLELEVKRILIPQLLEDSLGFNVYRVGLLFRRELMRALAEYKMTPEQWQVMMTLWHTGKPLNQSEIAKVLLKDKHTVSRILQRLERDEWIEKHTNPKDARVTIIALTKKGESLKNIVPRKLSEHFDNILQGFTDAEKELLLKLLKQLRQIFGDY